VGGLTVLSFSNNHLVYALTWFGLTLLSIFALFWLLRDRWRR
jgi:surfeit locus 1 family protein